MRRPRFRLSTFASLVSSSLLAWGSAMAQDASPGFALKLDPSLSEAHAEITEGRPVYGSSERLYGRSGRDTTLQGNAEVRKAGSVIRADRLTYYEADDELLAAGHVRVSRQGNVFTGPELALKLDANTGWFESPSYYLALYDGRGTADRIDFLGPDRMQLTEASYTTCQFDDPDWILLARSMTLDQEDDEGTGRSASLYFKGVKILAAPVFAFPLSDRRRSGFLPPSVSLTSRSGLDVVVPYYWNIAPNRDLTLYPRVSTRRGLQMGAEFRYLQRSFYGGAAVEWNPDDRVTGTSRYFFDLHNTFTNWGGWGGAWNVRGVSDDNYFVDYGRSIVSSSERLLPRVFTASRALPNYWTAIVSVQTWQSILDARPGPYERVPQLQLRNVVRDAAGFDVDTVLDATRFSAPTARLPEGWRSVANPQLSYPIVRPGWFVVPKAQLHLSSYQIDSGTGMAFDSTESSAIPTFSIDSGLVFERPARFFGRDVTQTLEPRLFYARTPFRDQSRLPVYDTTTADFNFAQLFSENTFVGYDRVADVNQLTAAAVSRLIDPASGAERFRFAVGQRVYFSSQRVSIPGVAPRTDQRSDLLLAASGELGGHQSFDTGIQYSVRDKDVARYTVLWRYLPPDGRILNTGVRYRRNEIGQFDTSLRWPVAPRWVALGRLNYSFLGEGRDPISGVPNERGLIESVLGFEYESCCWGTRFVVQRFRTALGRSTTAFFIQLELKGLARLGSDPFGILRRNIPGYRLPTDRPELPSRYFGYE
ncbi:MAG: LPS-assembly protein LptD [Burkholderiaceae bacterium]|jgi:LPS-assembly protein|nr:LPS-assembly protein LptD [Burkholderiaceae bacterium]